MRAPDFSGLPSWDAGETQASVEWRAAALGNVSIRSYRRGDGEAFRKLNEQWITHYFRLEPQDLELLADPETHILAQGGRISIATLGEEIVGCCALLLLDPHIFEVARMAVRPDYRGRGVGRLLLTHVVETARSLGASKLILETSEILANAVHLYESFGFRRTPPNRLVASPLARADLFMELTLSDE